MKLLFKTRNSEEVDLQSTLSFGRVAGDLTFPEDDLISGRHGKFLFEGGKAFILDTGSTNGTFLNAEQLEPNLKVELHDGDTIRFGSQIVLCNEQGSEVPKAKTAQELLAQAKKNKESKALELGQKQQTKISTLKKLTDELATLTAEIASITQAIADIDKRIQQATTESTHIETDKDSIRKSIEDKKKPVYNKQATLQDKLKLLELAQAPDDQKAPLRDELKKVQEQLKQLDNEKTSLPQKIMELKKKVEAEKKQRLEYESQLNKLNEAFGKRHSEYAPEIQRLEDELQALDSSISKAKESLKK